MIPKAVPSINIELQFNFKMIKRALNHKMNKMSFYTFCSKNIVILKRNSSIKRYLSCATINEYGLILLQLW